MRERRVTRRSVLAWVEQEPPKCCLSSQPRNLQSATLFGKTVFSAGVKVILEFTGGLVVRIPDFHCRDPGSIWIT